MTQLWTTPVLASDKAERLPGGTLDGPGANGQLPLDAGTMRQLRASGRSLSGNAGRCWKSPEQQKWDDFGQDFRIGDPR